ncbi:MAG: hypothetical protein IJM18_01310 [Clostridia bacterium]|nr:hypothetical protein [Clostridia bacterium]
MENIVEWIRLSVSLGGTNAGGALVRKYGSAEKISGWITRPMPTAAGSDEEIRCAACSPVR